MSTNNLGANYAGQEAKSHCRYLHLPTVSSQCEALAAEAGRSGQDHLSYLAALLYAERDDREGRTVGRRLKEAHLPRMKTMEEFDFTKAPHLSATRIMSLARGQYLTNKEPVIFLGDSGTGRGSM